MTKKAEKKNHRILTQDDKGGYRKVFIEIDNPNCKIIERKGKNVLQFQLEYPLASDIAGLVSIDGLSKVMSEFLPKKGRNSGKT